MGIYPIDGWQAVSINDPAFTPADEPEWSMMAWVCPRQEATTSQAICGAYDGSYYYYMFRSYGFGEADRNDFTSGVTGTTLSSGVELMEDTWHHVGLTFDHGTLKFYVDGECVRTVTEQTCDGPESDDEYFGVGCLRSVREFNGYLADFLIAKRVYTASEFTRIAGAQRRMPVDLIEGAHFYWTLLGPPEETVTDAPVGGYDLTGNGYNGTGGVDYVADPIAPQSWANGLFGGTTADDNLLPVAVATLADLDAVRNDLAGDYVQTADIDASPTSDSGSAYWNSGAGWEPIGDDVNHFTGTYDGSGYEITGLFADRDIRWVALFGYTDGGDLADIHLVDVDVTSTVSFARVGGLVGRIEGNTTIARCSVTGAVTSPSIGGGLVGRVDAGSILECYADVTVDAPLAGGITGYFRSRFSYHFIDDCYAVGTITGTGSSYVGGLVGEAYDAAINRCYAACEIGGSGTLGGLVAEESGSSSPVEDSFWDTDVGPASSVYGTGKTTSQMQALATFDDTVTEGLDTAWDICRVSDWVDEIWVIADSDGETYPAFEWSWVAPPTTLSLSEGVGVGDVKVFDLGRTFANATGVADAVNRQVGRALFENVTSSDDVAKMVGMALVESVGSADVDVVSDPTKLLEDLIEAADGLEQIPDRALVEMLNVDDATASEVARSLAEAIAADDELARQIERALAESVDVADVVETLSILVQALSESTEVADAIDVLAQKVLTEAVALDDAVARTILYALASVVTVTDLRTTNVARVLTDAVSVGDGLMLASGIVQALVEAIALSDEVEIVAGKALVENIAATALMTRGVSVSLTDALLFGDSIARSIWRSVEDFVTVTDTITLVEVGAIDLTRPIEVVLSSFGGIYSGEITAADGEFDVGEITAADGEFDVEVQ